MWRTRPRRTSPRRTSPRRARTSWRPRKRPRAPRPGSPTSPDRPARPRARSRAARSRATAVGCTGGIGAGKSTVATLLSERGAIVLDADRLARKALEPGTAGYAAAVARFGPDYLRPDASVDRARLGELVFSDAAARAALEAIVHPFVGESVAAGIAAAPPEAVVVVEAALLVETGGPTRYGLDGLLVVDAPEELAIERLVAQRAMSEQEAKGRVAAQISRPERLLAADYAILNVGTLEELRLMVAAAWRWIESLRAGDGEPAGTT